MNYRRIAAKYARRNGVPVGLFLAQINQESGFNPKAVSSAGAIGIAQIVPRWHPGVNPRDPVASLRYAAKLMRSHYKKYGTWRDALSAYNSGRPWSQGRGISETRNYVRIIMGKAGDVKVPKGGMSTGKPGDFSPGELGMTSSPEQSALAGIQSLAAGNWDPFEQLNAMVVAKMAPEASQGAPKSPGGGGAAPTAMGRIRIAPGADRAGVRTHGPVLKLARQTAGIFGGRLTVTTGTNHSRLTVDGNVSNHWSGNAVDIAASGGKLLRMGRAALIAAGVPRKKAVKMARAGGLYNIGRWQIIFRTNSGGNHWDHLHLGYRG